MVTKVFMCNVLGAINLCKDAKHLSLKPQTVGRGA